MTKQRRNFEFEMSDAAMEKSPTNRRETRENAKELFQALDELAKAPLVKTPLVSITGADIVRPSRTSASPALRSVSRCGSELTPESRV